MPAEAFIDTNVLLYAISSLPRERSKALAARELLRDANGVISLQVLGEFYAGATSPKREPPLSHAEAVAWIQVWRRFIVAAANMDTVDRALEVCDRFRISYYDSLIVATAASMGCEVLYSEDLNDGQDYGGVTVKNPFK